MAFPPLFKIKLLVHLLHLYLIGFYKRTKLPSRKKHLAQAMIQGTVCFY